MKQAYLKLGILALYLSVSALAGEAQSTLPDGVMTRSTTAGNVLTDARE